MKFGGTSVADADRLRGVAALAAERAGSGVLLVLSAFSERDRLASSRPGAPRSRATSRKPSPSSTR